MGCNSAVNSPFTGKKMLRISKHQRCKAPDKYYTKQLWDEAVHSFLSGFPALIARPMKVLMENYTVLCVTELHPAIFLHIILKLHHPPPVPHHQTKKQPMAHFPHKGTIIAGTDLFFHFFKVNEFDGLCQHHFADSWSCAMFGVSWLQRQI